MRRVGKVTLEYTKEELAHLLQDAIANIQKVSIESMEFKDDKFVFSCVEGVNEIPQKEQISRIDFSSLISIDTPKQGQWGIGKAIKLSLANGVKCPLDKLITELKLKGFNGKDSYFRNYLIIRKDTYSEIEPNVFQLTEYFKPNKV